MLIGPIGSRHDMLAVRLPIAGPPIVETGCFVGTPDEFRARVAATHEAGQYADEYRAALAFIATLTEAA